MRKVYVKEQVCMGCHLCEVYCLQKHALSTDLVKAYKKESPRALPRVRVDESGIVSLSVRCQHCADAPCIRACLTGALYLDPATSLVMVDEERCIGCGDRTVDVHMRRLRSKIEDANHTYIETVRNIGYRFIKDNQP